MNRFLWAGLAALALTPLASAQTPGTGEPEIIIEMRGEKSAPQTAVSIWDKNARQLTRLFKGKDRTHVLYAVENVSSRDDILRSDSGKEYAFVRYGTNDGDYRKFLFKAESPQTFVACAANLQDVLAVNKKYGVNLGVSLKDFLRSYANQARHAPLQDASGKTLAAYKLNYSDINNKVPSPHYYIFDGDELILTLAGDDAFASYAKKQDEERAQNQAAAQTQRQAQQKQPAPRTRRPAVKALAYGGTTEDQMYMPRVLNPKFPAPKPSKEPAGTPLPPPGTF